MSLDITQFTGQIPHPRLALGEAVDVIRPGVKVMRIPSILLPAQAAGAACVHCGRDYPTTAPVPAVPVGVSADGSRLLACADETGRQVCGIEVDAGCPSWCVNHWLDDVATIRSHMGAPTHVAGVSVHPSQDARNHSGEVAGRFLWINDDHVLTAAEAGRVATALRDFAATAGFGCPSWCAEHDDDFGDGVRIHTSLRLRVGTAVVWANASTDGPDGLVDPQVWLTNSDMSCGDARRLADVLDAGAQLLDATPFA